jgi:GYF domain 2
VGEEWIVRVEGKEYGPVEIEELREWSREGRLIPANEVRRVGEERWISAGELPEVFGDAEPAAPPPPPPGDFAGARTWRGIFVETVRIYRRGFARFMLFGFLTSVPMFVLQWTFPKIALPDLTSGSLGAIQIPALPPVSMAMLVLLVLVWPVSAAGFQLVADDILRGRIRSMNAQFSAALRRWTDMLGAALLVYGSYFFWFFVPLAAMIAFSGGGNALLASFVVLLIGGFMVYMNARLFINFLFWQQTAALGAHPPLAALRESKELARSVPEAPRLERPLYRGAIVASVWLLLLLVLTLGVQLPFALARFIGVDNPEQAMALMRKMAESQTSDPLMFAADVAAAMINLLLRPLLASAFVVLYYDVKARSGRVNDDKINLE